MIICYIGWNVTFKLWVSPLFFELRGEHMPRNSAKSWVSEWVFSVSQQLEFYGLWSCPGVSHETGRGAKIRRVWNKGWRASTNDHTSDFIEEQFRGPHCKFMKNEILFTFRQKISIVLSLRISRSKILINSVGKRIQWNLMDCKTIYGM